MRETPYWAASQIVDLGRHWAIVADPHDVEGKDRAVVDPVAVGRKGRRPHRHIHEQGVLLHSRDNRRGVADDLRQGFPGVNPLPSTAVCAAIA